MEKFSEAADDGRCPRCGYSNMVRGVNAVTSNLAVGVAATLVTGGVFGPLSARKKVKCGGCGKKFLMG